MGKGCNVKYIENHYAEGNGTGQKVLNPVTKIYVGEDSVFTLETTQIKGVDATERENYIELAENAKPGILPPSLPTLIVLGDVMYIFLMRDLLISPLS